MDPVFIVGSPRSGTTWLQLLLAQFDEVATGQETRLFSDHLGPLRARWDRRREDATGLHTVLDEEAFVESCRGLAARVMESILGSSPGASVPLEKTPGHVFHMSWIQTLLPGSRFIHIVRDPRAVVNSMLRAGASWGADWAPTDARRAARLWRRHVEAGLRAGESMGKACREIRYEDLCRDPVCRLEDLARWLDLAPSEGDCIRAVEACSFANINTVGAERAGAGEVKVRPGSEPTSRTSRVGAWRDELSGRDAAVVEFEVGDLMARLGYEADRERPRKPPTLVVRDAVEGVRDLAASMTRRAFEILGRGSGSPSG